MRERPSNQSAGSINTGAALIGVDGVESYSGVLDRLYPFDVKSIHVKKDWQQQYRDTKERTEL